jgi:hypothetical protein
LWSSSSGPSLIDFDFIDGTRMAQALGQAAEEACITSLRMRRMPYIAVLTVVTAMTAGYTAWGGIGVTNLLTTHWPGPARRLDLTRRCEQATRNYEPCTSCSAHFVDFTVDRSLTNRTGRVSRPGARPTLVPAVRAVGSWPSGTRPAELKRKAKGM